VIRSAAGLYVEELTFDGFVNDSPGFVPAGINCGHRLMVQIQSTWFPLYDRNPQKSVPNIFLAQPGNHQKATQRVCPSASQAIIRYFR
jgi:hypothetical protein